MGPTIQRLLVLASILFCCRGASAIIGLAAAADTIAYAGALLAEAVNEAEAERTDEKKKAQLRLAVDRARNVLQPVVEQVRTARGDLAGQLEKMRQEHGGTDPGTWAAKDREAYLRTNGAYEQLAPVAAEADDLFEKVKYLNARAKELGAPQKNKEFMDAFNGVRDGLGGLAEKVEGYFDQYSIESSNLDGGGNVVVVPAVHVTLTNKSEDMLFKVRSSTETRGDWLALKPGESKDGFRLGDHGRIVVRAVSWDKYRQQMMNAHDRIASGEMQQAKIVKKNLPYMIHYGTDRLSTLLRSASEEYTWTWGNNIERVVGRTSEWAATQTVTPAPTVESSHPDIADDMPAITDDTVTWFVPRVENSSVEFTFQVQSMVRWEITREMANGQTTTNESPEAASGSLSVFLRI